jgi:hypothetical protein
MRTCAQKQHQSQKPVFSSLARTSAVTSGLDLSSHPILRPQRTIGNQAAQGPLQAEPDGLEAYYSTQDTTRFAHDFSQIPVYSKAPVKPQAKSTDAPGDVYEQEADRIADQVMATPAHHAVSGAPPRIQRFSGQSNRLMAAAAPASVDKAVAGPGRPLEPALRQDMEQRFGHDFSRVRVHSGAAAEQSAREVNAQAYTVGHNMVFGTGRFAPGTREGRRLIAHELTHVVQQSEADGTNVGQSNGKRGLSPVAHAVLQRKPDEKSGARMPDSKHLAKGTMEWRLEPVETFTQYDTGGWTKRRMQVQFTPHPSFPAKTITFVQTVLQTTGRTTSTPSKKPKIDILRDEYDPFYGMEWDPKTKKWGPESIVPPQGYKSAPSSATDRTAYLFDEPYAPPGQVKMFETVAVVPETGETLGALRWGVGKGVERVECTDSPSAEFGAAVERFYATPTAVGPDPGREERYDVILDEFGFNDATLTADQEKQLDPIVTKMKGDPKLMVWVGGFADAGDKNPSVTSEQRAQAVTSYLIRNGVPKENVVSTSFGATWARYMPSMKEGRNRRVQLRLRYPTT